MIVMKKALPRRTFLRGMGACCSAALAGCHGPAADRARGHAGGPVRRLGFLYIPMGATSRQVDHSGQRSDTAFAEPFAARRRARSLHRGGQHGVEERVPGHSRHVEFRIPERSQIEMDGKQDYCLGTTVDQMAAKQLGLETRLPSLELAMDLLTTVGKCDNGYACVYQNNLSWSSPTTPLPAEAHPRLVFERLFGDGGTTAERLAELREEASLLDWVSEDIARLQKKLGPGDRTESERVSGHRARGGAPDSEGRSARRRFASAGSGSARRRARDICGPRKADVRSAGAGLQGDVTRVTIFQLARETSNATYTEMGIARRPSSVDAQRRQRRNVGEMRQDQRLPRFAFRIPA